MSRTRWRDSWDASIGGWDFPDENLAFAMEFKIREAYPVNESPAHLVERIRELATTLKNIRATVDQLDKDIEADWRSRFQGL